MEKEKMISALEESWDLPNFFDIFQGLKTTIQGEEHFIYLKKENIIVEIKYITKEGINGTEYYFYVNILPNANDEGLTMPQFFTYSEDGFYKMCS